MNYASLPFGLALLFGCAFAVPLYTQAGNSILASPDAYLKQLPPADQAKVFAIPGVGSIMERIAVSANGREIYFSDTGSNSVYRVVYDGKQWGEPTRLFTGGAAMIIFSFWLCCCYFFHFAYAWVGEVRCIGEFIRLRLVLSNTVKVVAMRKCIQVLTACLFFLAGGAAFGQTTITLQADYWMPYNGDGIKDIGYILEIAKEIFEPLGYKVVFKLVPWTRAVSQAREGTCNGIIGALIGDAEGFVFPEEEQGVISNSFFVKTTNPWKYEGIDSLLKVRLGIIGDYSYFEDIDAYIKKHPEKVSAIFGEDSLTNLIQMLNLGRIDAIIEDKAVMLFMLKKLNLQNAIAFAGNNGVNEKLFVAFSPALPNSTALAKILSEGMRTLRKNGKLDKILAKYGLKDWK